MIMHAVQPSKAQAVHCCASQVPHVRPSSTLYTGYIQGRIKHRPTRPSPRAPQFRGRALSKVKEMCRHSYSLSHEKSEKMFRIVTCYMYPRVFTKEGSCGDCCLSCDSSFLLIG